jgi:hypothetical protein
MRHLLFVALLAACAAPAHAIDKKQMLSSEAFLGSHPDLNFRLQGLRRYDAGDHDRAFELFRRAARYADKPSQAMVAEMLWQGIGVPQDRALGYAWMDLAAERNYRSMVIKRETYWNELDEADRKRALAAGEAIYRDYGDAAAKPRMERRLRQARQDTTGSRVGSTVGLKIVIETPTGPRTIDGSQFYARELWEPERYWEWQEKTWNAPAGGAVEVGPLTHDTQ